MGEPSHSADVKKAGSGAGKTAADHNDRHDESSDLVFHMPNATCDTVRCPSGAQKRPLAHGIECTGSVCQPEQCCQKLVDRWFLYSYPALALFWLLGFCFTLLGGF